MATNPSLRGSVTRKPDSVAKVMGNSRTKPLLANLARPPVSGVGSHLVQRLEIFEYSTATTGREPDLAISPLFATHEARKGNAAELHAILLSQFESKPLRHWREKFRTYDIKWAPLPTLDEAVSDPQTRDRGAITNFEYLGHGVIETVSSPIVVAENRLLRL